jgi:hypothetical protein
MVNYSWNIISIYHNRTKSRYSQCACNIELKNRGIQDDSVQNLTVLRILMKMFHTVTWPFQASSSCIPCHILFYWIRLNISYRYIYDVLFKVFFYAKNGWISQKNLIYAAYLRFLNKMSKRVLGVILVFST